MSFTHGSAVLFVVHHVAGPYNTVLDITSGGALNCPAPWVYDASADVSTVPGVTTAPGACVAPSGPGCHSVIVKPTTPYQYVRGRVMGVQFGSVCAFGGDRPMALNGTALRVHSSGSLTPIRGC